MWSSLTSQPDFCLIQVSYFSLLTWPADSRTIGVSVDPRVLNLPLLNSNPTTIHPANLAEAGVRAGLDIGGLCAKVTMA
jgi:hypothetical protein